MTAQLTAAVIEGERPDPRIDHPIFDMRPQALAINTIAIILVLSALYFAASLLIPIASAVLLSMLLAPPVQFLERLHIPRAASAALIVLAVMGTLAAGLMALTTPAKTWIEQAPLSIERIQQKLHGYSKPLEDIKKATDQLQQQTTSTTSSGPQEVRVVRPALIDALLLGTPQAMAAVLSVIMLLYFMLASGDVFLRKLVVVIPSFHDKKRAVEIIRQIETDISSYLLNFTMVNVALGTVMAVVTASLGIPNPLLWGAAVAILNFVPYVGAVASMCLLATVGLQTFDSLALALAAPAALFVLLAFTAAVITPAVIGRKLLLNPVAIFVAILLWGWLWGIVGVLLAVPLLASFKIICERVEPLNPIAEFLTI